MYEKVQNTNHRLAGCVATLLAVQALSGSVVQEEPELEDAFEMLSDALVFARYAMTLTSSALWLLKDLEPEE